MTHRPVRQSFNRAATSYDVTATLQQQVAEQLLRHLHDTLPQNFSGVILDAGCGTGYCLNQLQTRYPAAKSIGLDFAESMLHQLPSAAAAWLVNADLEDLPLATGSIDLYVSSLAWQWCALEPAIREAARVLKPGGHLWIATLVEGTFHELRDTLLDAALTPAAHLLMPDNKEQMLQIFRTSPLQVASIQCDALTTLHRDFASLRHSIRGVGASHVPTSVHEPICRARRQLLIDAYETRRTSHGLPLTYNVLFLHAQRN
jgi:malonyl-CoA O-methyltransferase